MVAAKGFYQLGPTGQTPYQQSLEYLYSLDKFGMIFGLTQSLILLVGIMEDKDFETMLHNLAPMTDHLILSRPKTPRAAPPSSLKKFPCPFDGSKNMSGEGSRMEIHEVRRKAKAVEKERESPLLAWIVVS